MLTGGSGVQFAMGDELLLDRERTPRRSPRSRCFPSAGCAFKVLCWWHGRHWQLPGSGHRNRPAGLRTGMPPLLAPARRCVPGRPRRVKFSRGGVHPTDVGAARQTR